METIGKFFTGLILLIIITLLGGIVTLKLWSWFIVPLFDLKSLTLIQAIGLAFIIRYFTTNNKYEKDKKESFSDFIGNVVFSIVLSLTILFTGWLIHLLY